MNTTLTPDTLNALYDAAARNQADHYGKGKYGDYAVFFLSLEERLMLNTVVYEVWVYAFGAVEIKR